MLGEVTLHLVEAEPEAAEDPELPFLGEPARAVGGELGTIEWQADKDGAALVLPMRYDLLREGGNADSGEAETRPADVRLSLRYDSASGELRRSGL